MFSLTHCRAMPRIGLVIGCWVYLTQLGLTVHAEPQQWAVLIGVQEHDNKKLNLRFTENDVRRLRQTLEKRAGLFSYSILQMTDRQPWEDSQPPVTPPQEDNRPIDRNKSPWRPTLANLRRELPDFLAKPEKEDRVIVFFSGHGVLFEGKTYLVPRDFDASNPAGTGLKLAEVRKELDKCKARVKFLILDCCHAGNDKALDNTLSPAKIAKQMAKTIPNCVVLASCNEDETSKEWRERKQGVFTYWLCRGLEGAAADDRGRVMFDDLNRYVYEHVSQTVKQEFDSQQNPQRFGKVEGTPVVLTLKPEAPETLCRRLAEHLDLEVRRKKLRKIGVVEFLIPVGFSDQKLAVANLPTYCTEQVRRALQRLGQNRYEVIDKATMLKYLKGIEVKKVHTQTVLEQLGKKGGALDGIVSGVLRQTKRRINVQCQLESIPDGDKIGQTSGVLPLSEELYAALRRGSYYDPYRPLDNPIVHPQLPDSPLDDKARQHMDDLIHRNHPLLDKNFPFDIELRTVKAKTGEVITDATPRVRKLFVPKVVDDNNGKKLIELLVNAREGERFEIYVTNRLKHRVAVLLLVDGLNTLEQKPARIGHGRIWVIDAKQVNVIRGWTFPERKTPDGKSEIRPFKFVDAAKSVAGRQKFGESIGLITAAFFEEKARGTAVSVSIPPLGVGEGEKERRKVKTVNFTTGRLLAVVKIRYVDERELNRR